MTWPDVTPNDPTAARGQVLSGDPVHCCATPGCGDLNTVHTIRDNGSRGACTAAFCRCRCYTPPEVKP